MTQLLAGLTLDRTINTPLAHQLADHIQAAITAGRVPVGTWLENEKAVARRLGLSIPTVRQAVARLIAEGLVARQRGVGTRIVNDRVHRPPTITSLFDELARAGEEPTTRVLALRRVTPDEDLSVAFASKEPLWHVERLRSTAAWGPLALMESWVRRDIPGIGPEELEAGGLYQAMRDGGVDLRCARAEVAATTATPLEAKLLGTAPGAALLAATRRAYMADGRLACYTNFAIRPDRYTFTIATTTR